MNSPKIAKNLNKKKKSKNVNVLPLNQNQNTEISHIASIPTDLVKEKDASGQNCDQLSLKEKSLQEQLNIHTNNAAEFIEKLPEHLININLNKTLNEIQEIDAKCDFDKCKVKTTTIGQDCNYCKKRYCFKHSLPEVHGCADAIRRAERKEFLNPVPAKQKNEEKELSAAKKRLEAKLKNMKVARMQKVGTTSKK